MNWKNGRPKGTVKAVWQKTGMAIKKKKNIFPQRNIPIGPFWDS
jgi:hypothetical protein